MIIGLISQQLINLIIIYSKKEIFQSGQLIYKILFLFCRGEGRHLTVDVENATSECDAVSNKCLILKKQKNRKQLTYKTMI